MKKNKIIIGCSLIIIQLLSIIGNIKTGTTISLTFTNFNSFLYSLLYLLGYIGFGLVGAILLISCLFSHKKKSKTTTKFTTKAALITSILSVVLFVLLIFAHIIAEEIGIDNELYYILNDSIAFFVLPAIFVVTLTMFICKTAKAKPVSLRAREKAFNRLAKMKEHLDNGIITEAEFEQYKQDLLKKINKTEAE